jgi:hypothetical protein
MSPLAKGLGALFGLPIVLAIIFFSYFNLTGEDRMRAVCGEVKPGMTRAQVNQFVLDKRLDVRRRQWGELPRRLAQLRPPHLQGDDGGRHGQGGGVQVGRLRTPLRTTWNPINTTKRARHDRNAFPPAGISTSSRLSPTCTLKRFGELHPALDVEFVPVLFAGLLKHWDNKGPAELAPKRLHTYRSCVWTAAQHGIPFRMPPRHPFNPLHGQRLLVALGAPRAAVDAAFDFVFGEGRDLAAEWPLFCERLGVDAGRGGDADRRSGGQAEAGGQHRCRRGARRVRRADAGLARTELLGQRHHRLGQCLRRQPADVRLGRDAARRRNRNRRRAQGSRLTGRGSRLRGRKSAAAGREQAYFCFFVARRRGFAGAALAAAGGGASPSTPLSGQTLKAGHFLQPATMAIGQMVMTVPGEGARVPQYAAGRRRVVVCVA